MTGTTFTVGVDQQEPSGSVGATAGTHTDITFDSTGQLDAERGLLVATSDPGGGRWRMTVRWAPS